jgi:Golgi phosphoprotein 3
MTNHADYKPVGRLDATTAIEHSTRIRELMEGAVDSVTIDLSGVDYVSSAGLRVLLLAAKSAKAKGGKVILAAPRPAVMDVLRMSGFPEIIEIRLEPGAASVAPGASAAPASAAPRPPAPGQAATTGGKRLTLAEELVLLVLDDESGHLVHLPASSLELALAAALVMELALEGRVDTDPAKLFVLSSDPTGNAILDDALAQIVAAEQVHPTAVWLSRLTQVGAGLSDRVINSLVTRGVLRMVEKRLLWVFKVRAYPPTSGIEEREVKSRVMALLNSDDIPETHDALLIGLLSATGILEQFLGESEHERLRARINQIAKLEEISRELARAMQDLQVALAAMYYPLA